MAEVRWLNGFPEDMCEYSGHMWEDAGGGLLICVQCEVETWDTEARERVAERELAHNRADNERLAAKARRQYARSLGLPRFQANEEER